MDQILINNGEEQRRRASQAHDASQASRAKKDDQDLEPEAYQQQPQATRNGFQEPAYATQEAAMKQADQPYDVPERTRENMIKKIQEVL